MTTVRPTPTRTVCIIFNISLPCSFLRIVLVMIQKPNRLLTQGGSKSCPSEFQSHHSKLSQVMGNYPKPSTEDNVATAGSEVAIPFSTGNFPLSTVKDADMLKTMVRETVEMRMMMSLFPTYFNIHGSIITPIRKKKSMNPNASSMSRITRALMGYTSAVNPAILPKNEGINIKAPWPIQNHDVSIRYSSVMREILQ